jgi:hypothetical protein
LEGVPIFPSMPCHCELCSICFPDDSFLFQRSRKYLFDPVLLLITDSLQTVKKRQHSQEVSDNSKDNEDPSHSQTLHLPIVLSISNYVVLAFLDIAVSALLPLFLAMPLEIGGLDLRPTNHRLHHRFLRSCKCHSSKPFFLSHRPLFRRGEGVSSCPCPP